MELLKFLSIVSLVINFRMGCISAMATWNIDLMAHPIPKENKTNAIVIVV